MSTNLKFDQVEQDEANRTKTVDISVVIPARNEETRLPKTLNKLCISLDALCVSYEIIVVNDGSNDDTGQVIRIPDIKIIHHSHGKGITAAFKTGAKRSKGIVVMLCPADIDDFDFLRSGITFSQKYDVISISKRHPKSIVLGYNRWRWFLSNSYQRLVNLFFGNFETCTDTHYIKFYNGKILRSIIEKSKIDGPVGETELMLLARDAGATFSELPAKIIHEKTDSKTSVIMILRTLGELLKLRIFRTSE